MAKHITWAPFISRTGGFPIGAHQAIGHQAEFGLTYSEFIDYDEEFTHYYTSKYPEYKHYYLDKESAPKVKLDLIVCTPPCAGLSSLTPILTGKESYRGTNATKNEWMLRCIEYAMENHDPEVFVLESTFNLYKKRGTGMRSRLNSLAKNYNRSVSYVHTNASLHGLPHNRPRCYVYLWKSETAPLVSYYDEPKPSTVQEYLDQIPKDSKFYDETFNIFSLKEESITYGMIDFMKHKYGDNYRQVIQDSPYDRLLKYADKNNMLKEVYEYTQNKRLKRKLGLIFENKAQGRGYWDSSLVINNDDLVKNLVTKSIRYILHPTEERLLTIRECYHLMGFPHDFNQQRLDQDRWKAVTRTTPVNTSRDIVKEAVKFIRGELEMSDQQIVHQNMVTRAIDKPDIVLPTLF